MKSQDELGELAMHFRDMTECLAKREKASLDTNPLTGLPGGIAIENILKRKVSEVLLKWPLRRVFRVLLLVFWDVNVK